ncbi:hypothetical protein HMN09_01021000 [Mycena chlorophos]|uniref:Uncharacterized protein n=1 Tax=Mycena chlorophos TaxID=658473 RepID=A0A8H6SHN1_MYCCL|nr:hypothetical protein HMN09_01021000 [Mycena chlorophos]
MLPPMQTIDINEDTLRSLSRVELQSLAKKENVRPAHARSRLIRRILDKVFRSKRPSLKPRRAAPAVAPRVDKDATVRVNAQGQILPRPQAREHVPAPTPVYAPGQPFILPFRTTAAHPAQSTHPRRPRRNRHGRPTLPALRDELFLIHHHTHTTTPLLTPSEHLVPLLQRAPAELAMSLRGVTWHGHYTERDVLMRLHTEPELWDGSHLWSYAQQPYTYTHSNSSFSSFGSVSNVQVENDNSMEWQPTPTTSVRLTVSTKF